MGLACLGYDLNLLNGYLCHMWRKQGEEGLSGISEIYRLCRTTANMWRKTVIEW